jgi:hypothetical protein
MDEISKFGGAKCHDKAGALNSQYIFLILTWKFNGSVGYKIK